MDRYALLPARRRRAVWGWDRARKGQVRALEGRIAPSRGAFGGLPESADVLFTRRLRQRAIRPHNRRPYRGKRGA
ncbi:hypothetical protein GCM10017750_36450 [Streptomyces racemochromogenes]